MYARGGGEPAVKVGLGCADDREQERVGAKLLVPGSVWVHVHDRQASAGLEQAEGFGEDIPAQSRVGEAKKTSQRGESDMFNSVTIFATRQCAAPSVIPNYCYGYVMRVALCVWRGGVQSYNMLRSFYRTLQPHPASRAASTCKTRATPSRWGGACPQRHRTPGTRAGRPSSPCCGGFPRRSCRGRGPYRSPV